MGRWKVQIQLWLTAAVINIKRAVRTLTKTEPTVGIHKVTNRTSITGMFADAGKEIARVMHCIISAYESTSATVPAEEIHSNEKNSATSPTTIDNTLFPRAVRNFSFTVFLLGTFYNSNCITVT